MRNSLKEGLRKNLPGLFSVLQKTKQFGYNRLVQNQKKTLKEKIEKYYKGDEEAQPVLSFLRENPLEMIPYAYIKEYDKVNISVAKDTSLGLKYVVVNGNEIYFPEAMSDEYIFDSVRMAMIEQDSRSPHKYLPAGTIDIGGDIAVLCGASDCIYALQIVDKFNKIFLFEAEPKWVDSIKQTMRNYLHKIEIVPLWISDEDTSHSVTLDSFLKRQKGTIDYIQVDIEGMEINMLRGAKKLLQTSTSLKMSICCYHTLEQEKELTDFLTTLGYNVKPTPGFVLLWMQYPLLPPYLRRAVLYVSR